MKFSNLQIIGRIRNYKRKVIHVCFLFILVVFYFLWHFNSHIVPNVSNYSNNLNVAILQKNCDAPIVSNVSKLPFVSNVPTVSNEYIVKVVRQNQRIVVIEAPKYSEVRIPDGCFIFDKERNSKQYDLRIIVIVYNRAKSLLRLLDSLNAAKYVGDAIKLEVWIDRSKDGTIDKNVTLVTSSYLFKHGEFSVYPQPTHVGLYGQWLNPWSPIENSLEIAVILEDDCVVSPFFYQYLKLVHAKYDHDPLINGYALQGVSIKHSGAGGYLEVPHKNHVFLYPVLGSWGFSPSKTNWLMFLRWMETALSDSKVKPYAPNNIATIWYKAKEKSGKAWSMWTIWHVYYAWRSNETTLYPNFKDHQGLTANWMQTGLNYKQKNRTMNSNPLLTMWKSDYDKLPDNPVRIDLNGNIVK